MSVNARGNIDGDVRAAYDLAHPGTNGSADTSHPDYPDDDFDSAFGEPPADEVFDESVMAESKPRNPKGSRSRTPTSTSRPSGSWWSRRTSKGSKPSGGKKKPRISTEDILGGLWRGMAKLAAPLPPLQRTLRIQAPVAGLLLEDAVKDTVADTVLQPLARLAGQGKVVSALLGPPVIVTALMVHVQQRAQMQPPREPNPFFVSAGTEALRSSLMTWMEVAGPKFEIAIR